MSFDQLDRDDDSMLIAGLNRSGVSTNFGIYDVTTSCKYFQYESIPIYRHWTVFEQKKYCSQTNW